MFRYKTITAIGLLFALALMPIRVAAQDGGQSPLYVECGAEDYLQYRDEVLTTSVLVNNAGQGTVIGDAQALVDLVMSVRQAREALVFIGEVPTCTLTLHQATLNQLATTSDYLAVMSISLAFGTSDTPFLSELSQLAGAIDVLNGMIEQALSRLGWESTIPPDGASANPDTMPQLTAMQTGLDAAGLNCGYLFGFEGTYGYADGYDVACELPADNSIDAVKAAIALTISHNAIAPDFWVRLVLSGQGQSHAYFYTSDSGWLDQSSE